MARRTEKHRVAKRFGDYGRVVDADGNFVAWRRFEVTTGPYEPTASHLEWRASVGPGKAKGQDPGVAVVSMTFTMEHLPDWPIRFELELGNDGVIRPMRWSSQATTTEPDPTVMYRQLGGEALERQIEAELRQEVVWWFLPDDWKKAVFVKRRTGRRRATDLELALLAEEYCRAWEDDQRRPMALLAERRSESVDALRSRLDEAVKRNLFEKRGQGRAGGFLTPKAQELMETAGETGDTDGER